MKNNNGVMLLPTLLIGLAIPMGLGMLWDDSTEMLCTVVLVVFLFLGWPGYMVFLCNWAGEPIACRWSYPLMYEFLLMNTTSFWPGIFEVISSAVHSVSLVVGVIIIFVTVLSKTEE